MRIGITGATGFIGGALARAARQRGHGIIAFTRRKNVFLPWAREIRTYDPDSDTPLDPQGLDALVHLAGESIAGFWSKAKMARILESRTKATHGIVETLRNSAKLPEVFICASATGFYGNRGDEWLTESSSPGTGFMADVCTQWETEAHRASTLGMRLVVLRTGMVLGKGGGAWPLLKRTFSMYLGSRLGTGKQWIPWIHLDDEVRIIVNAIENPGYIGTLNLTAPHPVTNASLTNAMADLLGKPTFIPVPGAALRFVLGKLGDVVLDSARVQPKAVTNLGFQFKYPELPQALESLMDPNG